MRRIVVFLILIGIKLSVVFAQSNSLIAVKVLPLPKDKIRVDFQFSQPLKQPPANFITPKPPRIILDFVDSALQLPNKQRSKQINLGSLRLYNIVSMGTRVRAILDLERTVTYSGSMAGPIYTVIINGKSSDLLFFPSI